MRLGAEAVAFRGGGRLLPEIARVRSEGSYTHYVLGLSYMRQGKESGSLETLASAGSHFRSMLALNPDLDEAKYARQNLKAIEDVLATK